MIHARKLNPARARSNKIARQKTPERVRVKATPCDQQPRRWKSHYANGSRRFSGGEVALQMGAVISPAEKSFCKWEQPFYKWEKSFFRRKSHFVNVSSHFSGGKVTLQM
jgi:hypothetical protein